MGNIAKTKQRKPRSMDIRVAHTLAETITTTSEITQRILLLAANMVRTNQVGEDRIVKLPVNEIPQKVGGEAKSIYRAAKRVAKELRSLNYYISDNKKDAFVNAGVVAEEITLGGGFFEFQFTRRAVAEIAEVAAEYTLLHCRNVKRCSGGGVTLYMLLARWDSEGEVTLCPSDFPGETVKAAPMKHQRRVIDPFVEKFNALGAKIGLNLRYVGSGRGKLRTWEFTWLPRALHKLGDILDDGELGIKGGYDKAAEAAMRIDMYLRRHGVFDKAIPRLLAQLPHEVGLDIVTRSCDEAPHKPGVINKLIKGEIFEYLDGNTAEQISARRKDAQLAREVIEVEAKSEAAEEIAKVKAWLAVVKDDDFAAAAAKLSESEWELNARMKPPKNVDKALPKLKERAQENVVLAAILAAKAGVVDAV